MPGGKTSGGKSGETSGKKDEKILEMKGRGNHEGKGRENSRRENGNPHGRRTGKNAPVHDSEKLMALWGMAKRRALSIYEGGEMQSKLKEDAK